MITYDQVFEILISCNNLFCRTHSLQGNATFQRERMHSIPRISLINCKIQCVWPFPFYSCVFPLAGVVNSKRHLCSVFNITLWTEDAGFKVMTYYDTYRDLPVRSFVLSLKYNTFHLIFLLDQEVILKPLYFCYIPRNLHLNMYFKIRVLLFYFVYRLNSKVPVSNSLERLYNIPFWFF